MNKLEFSKQLKRELTENILPFWINHFVDHDNGGFYGALTNDLKIRNDVPRSSTLCARILWTYSAAYRKFGNLKYLEMANRAYEYLTDVFLDKNYGGVYWEVDSTGKPVLDRKHHYAQSFAIYGLTEYYRATNASKSLELSKELFNLLEKYAWEPVYDGYIEGSSRNWSTLQDMRLSKRDLNCRKSMNTMLHTLEAYTNLLRVWDDSSLRKRHRAIIEVFLKKIIDGDTKHLKLFFTDYWESLIENYTFGHDMECSWLLWDAAKVQGDNDILNRVREPILDLVQAVYDEGVDDDGGIFYEGRPGQITDTQKAWWAQAEAMVGFYNAFQITNQSIYEEASKNCWQYIQGNVIDHEYGEWFKQLHRDGTPDYTRFKAGPWDCPYHHSRACLEMIRRLGKT